MSAFQARAVASRIYTIDEESERLQRGKNSILQARDKPVPTLQQTPTKKPHSLEQKHHNSQQHLPRNQPSLQMQQHYLPRTQSHLPLHGR